MIKHRAKSKRSKAAVQLSLWSDEVEAELIRRSAFVRQRHKNIWLQEYLAAWRRIVEAERAELERKPFALYRHFDAQGTLLYVGMSVDPDMRLKGHKSASHWYKDIHRMTVDWVVGRSKVFEAERAAILNEKPLYNIAGADKSALPLTKGKGGK